MDPQGYGLWDVSREGKLTFEHLSAKIHPADRDRVRAAFSATRAIVGPYEIDFRILVGPDVRWISARGQGNDEGIDKRSMTGIFLDVTGRKAAEEGHELLAGEMSHRVKNLLAIAAGLTQITSRSSTSIEDMAKQLIERLTALGRAHDLVRPLPGKQGRAAFSGTSSLFCLPLTMTMERSREGSGLPCRAWVWARARPQASRLSYTNWRRTR
jgi:two-component sensor histidine kinase